MTQPESGGKSAETDTPETEQTAETEAQPAEHSDLEADQEEQGGSSFARTALMLLIFLLVVFGLALWLAPKLAPHLPAPIAKHMMPGQQQLDEQFASLNAALDAERAAAAERTQRLQSEILALTEKLDVAEQAAQAATEAAEAAQAAAETAVANTEAGRIAEESVASAASSAEQAEKTADVAATAATEAGKVAAAATRDAAALSRRMTGFDARLGSIGDELKALGEALAKGSGGEGAAPAELSAAIAQLGARVDALADTASGDFVSREEALAYATQDDLRSARTALETEIRTAIASLPAPDTLARSNELGALSDRTDAGLTELTERLATTEQTVAEAVSTAQASEAAASDALGKVEGAIRDASLRSAVAALVSRIDNGAGYGAALTEVASLTGSEPPAELADYADTGLPTTEALLRGFARPAQAAIGAEIEAEAGDGLLDWADAKIRAKVAGRPAGETEGDDAAAIVSRIEARLATGDPAAALAEAETLTDSSQAALGTWLDQLRARVAADQALDTYITSSGQQG